MVTTLSFYINCGPWSGDPQRPAKMKELVPLADIGGKSKDEFGVDYRAVS